MDTILSQLLTVKAQLGTLKAQLGQVVDSVAADNATARWGIAVTVAVNILPPCLAVAMLFLVRNRGAGWRAIGLVVAGMLHLPCTLVVATSWGLYRSGEQGFWAACLPRWLRWLVRSGPSGEATGQADVELGAADPPPANGDSPQSRCVVM